MVGKLLIFSVVVVTINAHAIPTSVAQVPEEIRELIPKELKEFFSELTEEDKHILREVSRDVSSFVHEDEALEALKQRSYKLWQRVSKLRQLVEEKIESLSEEAKTFVKEAIGCLRKLRPAPGHPPDPAKIKETITELLEKYHSLSDEAKKDLEERFPQTAKIFKNEKFKTLARSFLEKRG